MERIAAIQSVERAIWILKCFENHRELTLSEISRMLDLHKSTAFGLVSTLEVYNLLSQDQETGKYRLGIELFRLGSSVNINLRSLVAPYLDKLVSLCGETVNFMVRDGNNIVYIEKKESPHSMRISTSLGHRLPIHCTAGGKSILARMPEEKVKALMETAKFERYTNKTLLTAEAVINQLREIRRRGYAIDDEELEYGLLCLGVAIVNSAGEPVGAISISGPTQRMTPENQRRFADYLMDYSREISNKL